MTPRNTPVEDQPSNRERDRVPPGPRQPDRRDVPVQDPPEPTNQPDGVGEPDEVDEWGDEINPPVQDPALDPMEPARDNND